VGAATGLAGDAVDDDDDDVVLVLVAVFVPPTGTDFVSSAAC
jgi:hypothetical protein